MAFVLQYLNSIAAYTNWVITSHLKEYAFFAVVFVVIGLLLLIIVRSKIMYFFPIVFFVITAILIIMPVADAANFDWDYMLVLAFVNLVSGYILLVITSMALSRPENTIY